MASSSSATDSTSRFAESAQFEAYSEASTSYGGEAMRAGHELPSTSTAISQMASTTDTSLDQTKRQKFDRKIDIDDSRSNDAFAFNSTLKGNPQKTNEKAAIVACGGPK